MFWTATLLFAAVYAAIVTDKIDKTKIVLAGAALVLLLKILTQREALHDVDLGVDWNVIFLLISMMVIVNIMSRTGVFQYLAVRTAKIGRGEPFRIMVLFAVVTAVLSALLDNVTTVLLIAPVTLFIAQELEIDPVPFLITEALASNIGGTATLIGDPPNIMIGSKAGLDFMDFVNHVAPAVVCIMIAWLICWKFVFSKRLTVKEELKKRVMGLHEKDMITNPVLLKKSGVVLGLTILGFLLHGFFHYEPATVALAGMAALLLISGEKPAELLAEVEWPTIFFFLGLFIVIGGTVKAGLIESLSRTMIDLTAPTKDSMLGLTMVMLWFSGVASAVIDNIPYVATMNPLLVQVAHKIIGPTGLPEPEILKHAAMLPVWWALSLGACLGGNGTAIGASANVVILGLSEKGGHRISFVRFLKYGAPVTFLTLCVSMVYLYLRYYCFA